MKRALLSAIFSVAACCALFDAQAQKDQFAYAITGVDRQSGDWSKIRRFDFRSGTYTDFLFDGASVQLEAFDAQTKQPYVAVAQKAGQQVYSQPFVTGVAAMAYDKPHQRLYFTPMFVGQLRYLDLRTNKLFYITDQLLMTHDLRQPDGGKVVTRMVITPDGVGYAITNDGAHMARFTSGKKPAIEQMGGLIDAPENKNISIHSACTGYGGDMIADDAGNLYIITARNHVFKVTPANRLATYLGSISGLPEKFTVNGAVVDDEGRLLVSSGVDESDYYRVDPQSWKATPSNGNNVFRSSDLANSNYLQVKPAPATLTSIKTPASRATRNIQLYPNPATGGAITLQFHKVAPGDYNIDLVDVLGRPVQSRRISIAFEGQTQTLTLPHAKAVYLVRVTDRNRKLAHEEKLVVQ
ncbi:Por secretion system C-terminal sorting domain-containing protein [Cnuella takakiae]|uniref:Por secretion system C-terminal sorting domain-containing protein n=1 Tax=Cnuella takakiae TaxID=1302690 RepID=A0A1M5GW58_9BACT|nr:T9SS type A sorting domain-containing protein [Cnuella takakiae]SHG07961.1 Por secretion system C-terminal sorting domain-containing protein [Cnuella takakiae]